MSLQSSAKVSCPNCHRVQVVTIWKSINVTVEPKLRTSLFNGNINKFKCSACKHEIFLDVPLLYHDMERGFCVQFHPPQAIEEANFIDEFEPSYPVQLKGISSYIVGHIKRPHLVFDMNDLIYCVMFYEKLLSNTK